MFVPHQFFTQLHSHGRKLTPTKEIKLFNFIKGICRL